MKIYAELHGDMQKLRIKSRGDNNSGQCKVMTKEISKAIKAVATPSALEALKQVIPEYRNYGVTTLEAEKAGDRPLQEQSCMCTGLIQKISPLR